MMAAMRRMIEPVLREAVVMEHGNTLDIAMAGLQNLQQIAVPPFVAIGFEHVFGIFSGSCRQFDGIEHASIMMDVLRSYPAGTQNADVVFWIRQLPCAQKGIHRRRRRILFQITVMRGSVQVKMFERAMVQTAAVGQQMYHIILTSRVDSVVITTLVQIDKWTGCWKHSFRLW